MVSIPKVVIIRWYYNNNWCYSCNMLFIFRKKRLEQDKCEIGWKGICCAFKIGIAIYGLIVLSGLLWADCSTILFIYLIGNIAFDIYVPFCWLCSVFSNWHLNKQEEKIKVDLV